MNFFTFGPTNHELSAAIMYAVQRYIPYVSGDARDQSAVEVLEKMLFSCRHLFFHRFRAYQKERQIEQLWFSFSSLSTVMFYLFLRIKHGEHSTQTTGTSTPPLDSKIYVWIDAVTTHTILGNFYTARDSS